MSTNIFNFGASIRTGFVKINSSGKELFGSVVRQGLNPKTVTVRVSRYHFNRKFGLWMGRSRNFHAHDEEEFCKTGDKVVISACRKLSSTKHYYVRNIVKPMVRQNLSGEPETQYEQDALDYNKELRSKSYPF